VDVDDAAVAPAAFAEPDPLAAETVGRALPIATTPAPLAAPAAAAAPVAATSYVPAAMPATAGGTYVAAAGDSWWSLAERTYGDGRLYRALYAWNRAIDPRVSLVAGTPLQLPTRAQLATAWPRLVPRQ
jgi:nucleoid-associated protein YgaU